VPCEIPRNSKLEKRQYIYQKLNFFEWNTSCKTTGRGDWVCGLLKSRD
jgi:hypothetical protein